MLLIFGYMLYKLKHENLKFQQNSNTILQSHDLYVENMTKRKVEMKTKIIIGVIIILLYFFI